jgi:hypothetical protein
MFTNIDCRPGADIWQTSERHRPPPAFPGKRLRFSGYRAVQARERGAWAAYIGRIPPFFKGFRHEATVEAAKWPTSGAAFWRQLRKIREIDDAPANHRVPALVNAAHECRA